MDLRNHQALRARLSEHYSADQRFQIYSDDVRTLIQSLDAAIEAVQPTRPS